MQRPKRSMLSRVERDDEVTVHEDENAHLWAVSYSDFLMALLAFFILFFSIDPKSQNQVILNLAQEFAKKPGVFSGSGMGDGPGGSAQSLSNTTTTSPGRMPTSVFSSLSSLDVKVANDKGSLVVNFPDDIYRAGKHTLRDDKKKVMESFFELLRPYEGKVNIYFEGHADSSPLKIHRNNVVVDNFVLSSLRANTVLSLARNSGFSDKHMFIQAASSNVRNSRSLSVRIEPIEGDSL